MLQTIALLSLSNKFSRVCCKYVLTQFMRPQLTQTPSLLVLPSLLHIKSKTACMRQKPIAQLLYCSLVRSTYAYPPYLLGSGNTVRSLCGNSWSGQMLGVHGVVG